MQLIQEFKSSAERRGFCFFCLISSCPSGVAMSNTPDVYRWYLSDLGKLLREGAFQAKDARNAATGEQRMFEDGRLMAYNEVVSLLQQQARAFELSLEDVALEGIDPDNDLT
jgi:hypothetical protein